MGQKYSGDECADMVGKLDNDGDGYISMSSMRLKLLRLRRLGSLLGLFQRSFMERYVSSSLHDLYMEAPETAPSLPAAWVSFRERDPDPISYYISLDHLFHVETALDGVEKEEGGSGGFCC